MIPSVLPRVEFLNSNGEHEHDTSVSSVSITEEALVDFALFEEWTSKILRENGADMYRMKGVINARFAKQKWVYHAVHMIYNGDFEAWDEEEEKGNKLVFIGKNLDAAALRAGFAATLATPENLEKKLNSLRFKVGDRVECNMSGGTRMAGTISQLMYRDDEMEEGQVCPYKVCARRRTTSRLAGVRARPDASPFARACGRSSSTMARPRGPRLMRTRSFARRARRRRSARLSDAAGLCAWDRTTRVARGHGPRQEVCA